MLQELFIVKYFYYEALHFPSANRAKTLQSKG
jgi:hypothetical protein